MHRTYALFLWVFALPAFSENLYEVHVDSYPDPERIIERSLPICFDTAISKLGANTLENKNTVQDIVEICERVAKIKGLKLLPANRGRDCLHIGFEWEVSEAQRTDSGAMSSCWRF